MNIKRKWVWLFIFLFRLSIWNLIVGMDRRGGRGCLGEYTYWCHIELIRHDWIDINQLNIYFITFFLFFLWIPFYSSRCYIIYHQWKWNKLGLLDDLASFQRFFSFFFFLLINWIDVTVNIAHINICTSHTWYSTIDK